ncbi:inactive tyrosine-protein kinase transmembrane receptor ROR1-like isoform X3 [Rhopilema esculentum]|uniref:inactive tyrosine-protein kinase transmembrane receptor ROR1-like isoform X3 n=1 Tax=Rhopilema esculentum TaxID=499914 RepID=UPI0031D60B86
MAGCSFYGLMTTLMWISLMVKADGKQTRKIAGKCELYTGDTCKQYLGGKHVFIKDLSSQASLEARTKNWLETAQSIIRISDKCWPHAKILICYHIFPICDETKLSPLNKRFCQDECKFLEQQVCREEFVIAKSINAIKQFVPSCWALPRTGTPAHANCQKLPSLVRELAVEYSRNLTATNKDRVALKCHFKAYNFERKSDLKVYWVRNGTKLNMNIRKFRLKRRSRGRYQFVSTLIIKYVTFADAGKYDCVAAQGKLFAKSSVFLSVLKRDPLTDDKETEEKVKKVPNKYGDGLGRCVPYKGQVCAKYMKQKGSNNVFEYSFSPQSLVEKQLVREFRRIKKNNHFSDRCLEMSLAIMCFNVFNTCNKSATTPASRLCHEDCHLFDKVYCKYEVEMARKHTSAFEFLPDCTLLPQENKLCEPMKDIVFGGSKNGTKCYKGVGKDYDGKVNISKTGKACEPWINHSPVYKFTHNYCRNFGGENYAPWCFVAGGKKEFCDILKCDKSANDSSSDSTISGCYSDVGEDYRGQIKVSQSGKQCLQWNVVGSYEARHSYCRNYGGKREAPWCYVSKDKKEYCDIPKCRLSAKIASGSSPSLVYYVVPVAIVLSVLLLVVLVMLLYLKQQKKGESSSHSSAQVPNGDAVAVTTVKVSKDKIGSPRVPGPMDKQVPEVNNCSVNFLEMIGKGFFMELWKAELVENDQSVTPLLVKRLSADATKGLVNAFNLEISNVRGLDNPNIAELLCVSKPGAVPFLGYGGDSQRDLKTCLMQSRPDACLESRFMCVDYDVLIDMAVQICSGVEYLHENSIVHKDLGTRSCLIDSDCTVKIAHFGIGLYLHPGDYYHDNYMTLPARWMSPEALQTKKFTKSNDIWSLGVLFWELFSFADRPYGDVSDKEAMALVSQGHLLQCPDECPAGFYSLMKECWTMDPDERMKLNLIMEKLTSWNGTVC